jgi:hypothetical protein
VEAEKWLRGPAEQGNAKAQFLLGDAKFRVIGVGLFEGKKKSQKEDDCAEVKRLYQKASDQRYPEAMYMLAMLYQKTYFGPCAEPNEEMDRLWLQRAADLGNVDAQSRLSILANPRPKPEATPADPETLKKFLENAAAAFDGKKWPEVLKWAQKGAEAGDPRCEYLLGLLFLNGSGVPLDHGKALECFRKSAYQRIPGGQYYLGLFYMTGKVIKEDDVEGEKLFEQAAKAGHSDAQYNLAVCYEKGIGVSKDPAQAKVWFQKAADQGNAGAQRALKKLKTGESEN